MLVTTNKEEKKSIYKLILLGDVDVNSSDECQ